MRRAYIIDTIDDHETIEVLECKEVDRVAIAFRSGSEMHRVWLSGAQFKELCELAYRVDFKDESAPVAE